MNKSGHIAGVISVVILGGLIFLWPGLAGLLVLGAILAIALSVFAGVKASPWWFVVTAGIALLLAFLAWVSVHAK